jgi:hypothetical protein
MNKALLLLLLFAFKACYRVDIFYILKVKGTRSEVSHFGQAMYRGADKSLALPERKQATATEDFMSIYPIYNHNWREYQYYIYIYIYIYI